MATVQQRRNPTYCDHRAISLCSLFIRLLAITTLLVQFSGLPAVGSCLRLFAPTQTIFTISLIQSLRLVTVITSVWESTQNAPHRQRPTSAHSGAPAPHCTGRAQNLFHPCKAPSPPNSSEFLVFRRSICQTHCRLQNFSLLVKNKPPCFHNQPTTSSVVIWPLTLHFRFNRELLIGSIEPE